MSYCLLCGHDHGSDAPHMVFGTPITQVFGADWGQGDAAQAQPSAPSAEDVTALLADYQRLREKEDKAREVKAADMRRYRSNRRSREST